MRATRKILVLYYLTSTIVLMEAGVIRLDASDAAPIYVQIERAVRAGIATGRLSQGAQLPTVRQLAIELRVNANTVARVYSELERQGLVETRRGVGTFVASGPAPASKDSLDP